MNKTLVGITFALILILNPICADEKITFDSEEQYQDFLSQTSKTWKCDWQDQPPSPAKGTKIYTRLDGNTLNKQKNKVKNSACPNNEGISEGKYKKGKFVGKLKSSAPCAAVTKGHYIIYKKSDGSYYMKGPYSYRWTDGNTYKGNATCVPQ